MKRVTNTHSRYYVRKFVDRIEALGYEVWKARDGYCAYEADAVYGQPYSATHRYDTLGQLLYAVGGTAE